MKITQTHVELEDDLYIHLGDPFTQYETNIYGITYEETRPYEHANTVQISIRY